MFEYFDTQVVSAKDILKMLFNQETSAGSDQIWLSDIQSGTRYWAAALYMSASISWDNYYSYSKVYRGIIDVDLSNISFEIQQ